MALILSHQTACEYWLSPYAKSAYRPDPDKVHLFADPNYLKRITIVRNGPMQENRAVRSDRIKHLGFMALREVQA